MTKNNEFMRMDRRFFLSSVSKLLGVSVVSSIMPSIVAASELKDTLRIAIAKPAGDINPHKYTGLWGVPASARHPTTPPWCCVAWKRLVCA